MKKQRAKVNIPMCCAGVLLCLTLFSFYLCGGLYAKYAVTQSASSGARVARFDVSEDGAYFSDTMLMQTTPGSIDRKILFENNSEVAVACTVTIRNTTGNIPYAFSVSGSAPVEDECVVTCYLKANTSQEIEITADWAAEGALEYMGMVDLVQLSISAQQVD